jgi:hypothetical protein
MNRCACSRLALQAFGVYIFSKTFCTSPNNLHARRPLESLGGLGVQLARARFTHIALARKPSGSWTSGLLVWARATSHAGTVNRNTNRGSVGYCSTPGPPAFGRGNVINTTNNEYEKEYM